MKRNKLTNDQLSRFCRAMAMTLHAGVSTGDALQLLWEDEPAGNLRDALMQAGQQADRGASLSEVLSGTGLFPKHMTGLVEVGIRTGRVEEALNALADYYEQRDQMDWRIRNALTYPAVLLLLMLVVVVVLLTKVLPVFEDVYASLGGRLSGVAGGLLILGQWLNAVMPVLVAVLILAVILVVLFAFSERVRDGVLAFWRRRRGDKGLSRVQADARFAQAMAMGLRSGLPLNETVELAAQLMEDTPAAVERCRDCISRLNRGEDLAQALRQSQVLPAQMCRLLAMGLRSGSGDSAMDDIARRLWEQADRTLERRVSRVEPALVLAASLLVGAILLSVMLPLMHIMTAIR